MSMKYIREFYGVQARRGGRVRYTPPLNSGDYASPTLVAKRGKPGEGVIKSAKCHHLMILLDGDKKPTKYHPTWCIEYL